MRVLALCSWVGWILSRGRHRAPVRPRPQDNDPATRRYLRHLRVPCSGG